MRDFIVDFNYDTFLQLVIIVLGTIVIAQVVTFLIAFIGKRFVHKTETDFDDKVIDLLKGPVFYTITLSGVYMSLRILFFGDIIKNVTLPIFQTILIIIWSVFLVRFIKVLFDYFSQVNKVKFVTIQTLPLFLNTSFVIVWAMSVYFMFNVWGINMTAWLASAGVAGIAIGFAAKDTLANLISGVFILTDAPYKIGDWIVLDSGERGKVTDIGIRTTRMKNTDDMEVTVPNAVIGNATLTNESGGDTGKEYRVKIPFGVAYGSDIDEVEKLVLDIADKNENALQEPAPRVRFRMFGASSLDYELLVRVKSSAKKGITTHELNRAIYKTFSKEGIEIPYAKQDLYIKEMPKM
ncbi:MAG: mechanosensitive ion channel family protein [Candidatus Moraniibacteriota bacterium]|jgi:MscS family membrane protein